MNNIFATGTGIEQLCEGILIPINKPNKARIVSNTRAITLLSAMRKLLSLIVLDRIIRPVEEYLPPGQCGFRRNRSAAEVFLSYQWLEAAAQKYQKAFFVMGIDMSMAFDTMDRGLLLDALKFEVKIDDSSFRIIHYLLLNTTLQVRVQGELGRRFKTVLGSPQGDALSPILFVVYLEAALRRFRQANYTMTIARDNFYMETMYADDVDFVSDSFPVVAITETMIPGVLAEYRLKVNESKTELTTYTGSPRETPATKKLGSKLNAADNLKYRMGLAVATLNKLWRLWKSTSATKETKLKMYKACILPILMYNMGACSLSLAKLEKLDSFHRRQLRKVIGIRYPEVISNQALYTTTDSVPLSLKVVEYRWKLMGHVLRRDENSPAMRAIKLFLSKYATGGGRQHTIVTQIVKELRSVGKDLHEVTYWRNLALDRKEWSKFVGSILASTKILIEQRLIKKSIQRKQAQEARLARKRAAEEEAEQLQEQQDENNQEEEPVLRQQQQQQHDHMEVVEEENEEEQGRQSMAHATPSFLRRSTRLAARVLPQQQQQNDDEEQDNEEEDADERERFTGYWMVGGNERKRIRAARCPEKRRVVRRRSSSNGSAKRRRRKNVA